MPAAASLSSTSSFGAIVSYLIGILNMLIPVFITFMVVMLMWAGFKYVSQADSGEGKQAGRDAMLWILITLFVAFSVWGILRIVCNTFLGPGSCGFGGAGGATGAPLNIVPDSAR
ncbi:MAG TPA: hypothetical protein VHD37_03000 [Candidatus Paceibacterota bacterium]|jgi:hypothetical protein|nr:hypothetical protein [Candidatus Paceibacterota bacterium]